MGKNQRKHYFGGGGEVSTIADATNIRKELLLAIEKLESAHVAVCQANARVRKIALTEESTSVPMSHMKRVGKSNGVYGNNLNKLSNNLQSLLEESNDILDKNSKSFILDYVRNPETM